MKNFISKMLVVMSVLFFGNGFNVMADVTSDLPVRAVIQVPTPSFDKIADLNFGTIVAGSVDTEVTIKIDDTVSTDFAPSVGGATLEPGTTARGELEIGGNITGTIGITYAVQGESLRYGVKSMEFTSANVTANSTGSVTLSTLGETGTVYVGGILKVAAGQRAGEYVGVCVITANYN